MKKIMAIAAIFAVGVPLLGTLSACEPKEPSACEQKEPSDYRTEESSAVQVAAAFNENASLELGFLEDLSGKDLSAFTYVPGFGCSGYYPSSYGDYGDAAWQKMYNGEIEGVYYTVTAYPDYADGGKYVTSILIADPATTFANGCTVQDCGALFAYLGRQGFTVADEDGAAGPILSAENEQIRITHYFYRMLVVTYKVSNRDQIIF